VHRSVSFCGLDVRTLPAPTYGQQQPGRERGIVLEIQRCLCLCEYLRGTVDGNVLAAHLGLRSRAAQRRKTLAAARASGSARSVVAALLFPNSQTNLEDI
jgi:hypothetical protein